MRRSLSPERVLATILFTDLVGSTELAARLGDRRWEELRRRHHVVVRAALKRFRGREIDTAGDGFFAIFDRPAQAIGCAVAVVEPLRSLGLTIRAGIHIGEIEIGREKVGGIAVHTGARVLGAARSGEILVTAMVKDLVAGSDFEFDDRGVATLKGVPGEWRLFAVRAPKPHAAAAAVDPEHSPPGEEVGGRRASGFTPALVGLGALISVIGLGAAMTTGVLPSLLAGPVVPGPDMVGRVATAGDAFDLAVKVGARPTALAVGEGAVWVLNFGDQTLSRVDPAAGEVVGNPAVGGSPTGLAVGGGFVWVTTAFGTASGEPGSVMKFDPALGQRLGEIPLGSGTAAIAFGEGSLWVADRLRDKLLRVDPRTYGVDEIAVGRTPEALAVGHGSIWVTSTLDSSVWRVRVGPPFDVTARIPLSGPPTAVAVGTDAVWVTSDSGDSLTRIDPLAGTLTTTVNIGNRPGGVAVSENAVWVAVGGDGHVARVDPVSNSVAATIAVDGVPDGVAVDDQGTPWVTVHAP